MRLVQLRFDFYMIEAKPENLIGDRAYDSDPLDHALRQDGIEMIAPHRSNRTKPPTQDRRRLRRFLRRWLVERFFAWIQWQRRILVRWEYHPENFLGFVHSPASLSSSGDFEIGSKSARAPAAAKPPSNAMNSRRLTSSVGTCPFRKSHPAWESHCWVESSHDRGRCSRSMTVRLQSFETASSAN